MTWTVSRRGSPFNSDSCALKICLKLGVHLTAWGRVGSIGVEWGETGEGYPIGSSGDRVI